MIEVPRVFGSAFGAVSLLDSLFSVILELLVAPGGLLIHRQRIGTVGARQTSQNIRTFSFNQMAKHRSAKPRCTQILRLLVELPPSPDTIRNRFVTTTRARSKSWCRSLVVVETSAIVPGGGRL